MIRKHRTAFLAAAVYNIVLFFPVLFMGRVISPNDVFFNYQPWASVRQVDTQNSLLNDPATAMLTHMPLLRSGEAFHWNPYIASGIPGSGSSALSPFLVIPALLFPIAWLYTAMIFLKLNFAFVFAYLWLREERLGKRGAAIGAVILAGAGVFAVRWLWQSTSAAAFYPVLLWLVRRIFNGRRNPVALTAVVALGYSLVAFPSAMAYGAYLVVTYSLFLMVRERRFPARGIARGVAAVAIALLIAAPSLVSFIQFVERTGYLGAREEASLKVFFPLSHFRGFIDPDRLGNPAYKNWRGDPALGSLNNYYEYTIYLGLVALPLSALALFSRRARTRWYWFALAGLIVAGMFGLGFAPRLLGRLPGFRYSPLTRAVVLLPVCAGYLSAAGSRVVTRWRFRGAIAACLAVAAAFDLALFAGRFYPYLPPSETVVPETPTIAFLRAQPRPFRVAPFFIYFWPNAAELFRIEDVRSHFSSEAKYRRLLSRVDPTSSDGASTVIQFNSLKFDFSDPIVGMLGVRYLIENRDIDIVKWSIFAATRPGVTEHGALVIEPGKTVERTVTVGTEPFWAIELPVSIQSPTAPAPSVLVDLVRPGGVVYERSFSRDDLEVMGKVYVPLRPYAGPGDSVTLRITPRGASIRMLGSAPVAGETPFFYGRVETPIIFDRQLADGRIFLNLAEVPRFRAARRLVAMSAGEFLARRDIDLSTTAVVTSGTAPGNEGGPDASVELTRYLPDSQVLTTSAKRAFFLASSEKLTPELRVTIDGDEARTVEINTMFAGVGVRAGRHRVEFSRRIGRGWWAPSAAGAIALVVVALIEAIAAFRRRRAKRLAPVSS